MPNHVQNRLEFNGNTEKVRNLRDTIKSEPTEEGQVFAMDFNKIIPMPESMRGLQPHSGVINDAKFALKINKLARPSGNPITDFINGVDTKMWVEEKGPLGYNDNDKKDFIKCIENGLYHGHVYWRDWAIENWNTKWNAYDQKHDKNTENCIFYSTAWNTSIPIVSKLSEMFPEVGIKLTYADEDSGSNVGYYEFLAGELVEENKPEDLSNEAYEIYLELHPESKEYIKKIDGKYQYIDED